MDKSALLSQLKIEEKDKQDASDLTIWHLLIAIIISAGVGYFAANWLSPEPKAEKLEKTAKVETTKPDTTKASTQVSVTKVPENEAILNSSGYITARRMATVSAEVMGLITQVNVEEGMKVEQGQVLAVLDDAVAKVNLDWAKAQVSVQQAQLKGIEADLAEARRDYERAQNNSYSSQADLTGTLTRVKSLEANIEQVQASIKASHIETQRQRERLDDHTIRAPFAGVVTVKNAQPGEIVAPTSAGGGFTRTGICTIVDMDSLEIEVDVNEAFIGRVYPGQSVEATLDAYPDWRVPASVIAIIPTADRAKATVQVRIRIETKDSRILPDMGVKVAFLKDQLAAN